MEIADELMGVQKLLILGRGNFAVEVADLVDDMPGFTVAGFVENMEPERCKEPFEGYPLYWADDIPEMARDHQCVCALGTTRRYAFIERMEKQGFRFAKLIHPTARVSGSGTIGDGSIVSAGVVTAARSRIGRHVIINRGALIGHHTEIGDFTTVGPGANIAGSCKVGSLAFIGMGAIINDHITIGSNSVVGSGAVVTRDVPNNVQVTGVPARIVKEGIEGK